MDKFYLEIDRSELYEDTDIPHYHVEIVINGRRLIDLAREIEQPFADAEGKPDLAGAYQRLAPWVVLLPSRYLLPENEDYVPVLICGSCGDWGCWSLEVHIIIEANRVIWRDFYQPHRSKSKPPAWSYKGLGPFEFERQQYEAELGKLLGDESYQDAVWYWADWLQGDRVRGIQEKVAAWASQRDDIRAVALVGSWARCEANLFSDVDLLLLTTDPEGYRGDTTWPFELELTVDETWHDTDHETDWSRHLTVDHVKEIEMIFAPVTVVNPDARDTGLIQLINKGCEVLYDPDGLLANLAAHLDEED